MKYLPIVVSLFIAFSVSAQSFKKNEVVIGYGGGYFFDETYFNLAHYTGPFRGPIMGYTRRFTKRFSLRLVFSDQRFDYFEDLSFFDLTPNTTFLRFIERWGVSAGYSLTTGVVPVRVSAGLVRCSGAKVIFRKVNVFPFFSEAIVDGPGYTKLGGLLALSIGHPIVWRFFGELEGEYLRVNTDIDPAQFYLSYRIGFKF